MKILSYHIDLTGRGDKLIVLTDAVIYISNHSKAKLAQFESQLKESQIPKELTGIPIKYIKELKYQAGSRTIKIEFKKDSSETISFSDTDTRDSFIQSLVKNFNGLIPEEFTESSTTFNKWLAVGLLLLIAIIIPSYYLALSLETNPDAVVSTGSRPSVLGALSVIIGSIFGPTGTIIIGLVMLVLLILFLMHKASVIENGHKIKLNKLLATTE